jgi:hypothetical protein
MHIHIELYKLTNLTEYCVATVSFYIVVASLIRCA